MGRARFAAEAHRKGTAVPCPYDRVANDDEPSADYLVPEGVEAPVGAGVSLLGLWPGVELALA